MLKLQKVIWNGGKKQKQKQTTHKSLKRRKTADKLKIRPKYLDAAFLDGRFEHYGEGMCIICLTELDSKPYKPACCERDMCEACTKYLAQEWVFRTKQMRGIIGIMRCMGCRTTKPMEERVLMQISNNDPACERYRNVFEMASEQLLSPRSE